MLDARSGSALKPMRIRITATLRQKHCCSGSVTFVSDLDPQISTGTAELRWGSDPDLLLGGFQGASKN
jgi:hypothetical protein